MDPSVAKLIDNAQKHGKPLEMYKKGTIVHGGGKMGLIPGYKYVLEADPGKDFDPRFKPVFTPAEMLFMGVFEGKYLNDCWDEFPKEWFLYAAAAGRLSPQGSNIECNHFKIGSRQPLGEWQKKGWAPREGRRIIGSRPILGDKRANPDERGWFQWYCRYWLGRRIPELDNVQIGRWRSFNRHAGTVRAKCRPHDLSCSVRERQALLQWSYDPFI